MLLTSAVSEATQGHQPPPSHGLQLRSQTRPSPRSWLDSVGRGKQIGSLRVPHPMSNIPALYVVGPARVTSTRPETSTALSLEGYTSSAYLLGPHGSSVCRSVHSLVRYAVGPAESASSSQRNLVREDLAIPFPASVISGTRANRTGGKVLDSP